MVNVKITGFNSKLIGKRIFNNDKVGLFSAQCLNRHMIPYVPMDTGTLYESTNIKPFEVEYYQNYASTIFYNNRHAHFRIDKHPLATSRWDKATAKAHGKDIAREIERYIGG